jgi:hypothetical protein
MVYFGKCTEHTSKCKCDVNGWKKGSIKAHLYDYWYIVNFPSDAKKKDHDLCLIPGEQDWIALPTQK